MNNNELLGVYENEIVVHRDIIALQELEQSLRNTGTNFGDQKLFIFSVLNYEVHYLCLCQEFLSNDPKQKEIRRLTYLPESFGNLITLRVLILDHNNFDTLPESFVNLQTLETLDLSHNKFQFIPNCLQFLNSLRELKMSANCLNGIPAWLIDMPNLRILEINKNPINFSSIEFQAIAGNLTANGVQLNY